MSWFAEPFASSFTQRAALMCVLVGILAPAVGTWTVLRGVSYLGDAMSHATIGGVAIGFAAIGTAGVLPGALVAGVVMSGLISLLSRRGRLDDSALIGVIESAMFAIGVLVISRLDSGVELGHFLFGQLLTVTQSDLVVAAALTTVAVIVVAVLAGDFRMTTFDELHARHAGVRVEAMRTILLVLVAVTVVVCLRTVGALTSMAMLVVPASTARLVTNDTTSMSVMAVAIGLASSLTGFVVSYRFDAAPGACIALTACSVFAVVQIATLPRRHRHASPAAGVQNT